MEGGFSAASLLLVYLKFCLPISMVLSHFDSSALDDAQSHSMQGLKLPQCGSPRWFAKNSASPWMVQTTALYPEHNGFPLCSKMGNLFQMEKARLEKDGPVEGASWAGSRCHQPTGNLPTQHILFRKSSTGSSHTLARLGFQCLPGSQAAGAFSSLFLLS